VANTSEKNPNDKKRKNVFLEPVENDKGEHDWKLTDLRDNSRDPNFDVFQKYLRDQGLKYNTRKRYSEVLSIHIDYLIERGVYGDAVQDGVNLETINDVISDYIKLMAKGDKIDNPYLKQLAQELHITRHSANSYNSAQAALNHFYTLNQRRATAARNRLKRKGFNLPDVDDYEDMIIGVTESKLINESQKKSIRQTSMLGGVIRWHGEIKRPKSIPSISKKKKKRAILPFPLKDISKLLQNANSYRDRLLWSILAFGGPRPSEALQIRRSDIDPINKTIDIPTEEEVQESVEFADEEKVSDKARNKPDLWILHEPFKSELWKNYRLYMREEYVPLQGHDFLFQYNKPEKRGQPYYTVDENSVLDNFRAAIKRAGIEPPPNKKNKNKEWDLYSLRHFYVDYLKNDFPNEDGTKGLSLEDTQYCVGHDSVESTKVYAREREENIKMRFLYADAILHQDEVTIDNIAGYVANEYRKMADKIDDGRAENKNKKIEHKEVDSV